MELKYYENTHIVNVESGCKHVIYRLKCAINEIITKFVMKLL